LWKTTLDIDDFPLLLIVSIILSDGGRILTFVGPSIAISAFPSQQRLGLVQESYLHLSFVG
jgi:hypothetical protein